MIDDGRSISYSALQLNWRSKIAVPQISFGVAGMEALDHEVVANKGPPGSPVSLVPSTYYDFASVNCWRLMDISEAAVGKPRRLAERRA